MVGKEEVLNIVTGLNGASYRKIFPSLKLNQAVYWSTVWND
jgi:hypothetical protein